MPHLPISEGAQWVFQRRRGIQAIIHGSRENQSPIVRANIEKWDAIKRGIFQIAKFLFPRVFRMVRVGVDLVMIGVWPVMLLMCMRFCFVAARQVSIQSKCKWQ